MKIRKLFKETDTSNVPVRISVYVRYLNLQHYETGMQHNTIERLLQLLQKIYPIMNKKVKVMQVQVNNMELCPKFSELDGLCPVKLMLISQIIQFMFIVVKTEGA